MENDPGKNRIESLKKNLYRRNFRVVERGIGVELPMENTSISSEWTEAKKKEGLFEHEETRMNSSIFKKLFVVSFAFFVIATIVASFLFFGGGNVVSSDNIDIEILGPVSTEGGEELSLQVVITNNNSIPLQFSDLVIEYPPGTHSPENEGKEMPRSRTSLGAIAPGETVNEIVRAVLFGEEGSEKEIHISFEYRVEGSNAIFVKEKTRTVTISSSPINLAVDMLNEVNSNQEIEIKVRVSSNSAATIEDVLLRLEYPFGFEAIDASPRTTYSNNIWSLGDLPPEGETTVIIKGIMRGQDNEEKIFSAYVGKQNTDNEREIATVYSSSFEQLTIKKPFIGVTLELNGEIADEYVVGSTQNIKAVLTWTNNLTTRITDAVIEVKIAGEVLNKLSVIANNGNYNSSVDTIVWDKTTLEELASLEPGATGRMIFNFSPKSLLSTDIASLRNPKINLSVSARGRRASESDSTERVDGFVTRIIKINSDFLLTPKTVYYAGPFINTGPIPPKAEVGTTYTIIWTVINSSNSISGGQVNARIPAYVEWIGAVSPKNEPVSYNANTREITWKLGDVDAGRGISSTAEEVAFQLLVRPSVSHIGRAPEILTDIILSGQDDFTGKRLENTRLPLTTHLGGDPAANAAASQVVQ
ncbi:MAG: hypothetical protein NUV49_02075 [Patescibacteria group bacterium]|nr:hypothetical protein [Patescibacteria group bacterium]